MHERRAATGLPRLQYPQPEEAGLGGRLSSQGQWLVCHRFQGWRQAQGQAGRRVGIKLQLQPVKTKEDRKDERGPDEYLKLGLEALSQFDAEEKIIAKKVLQGLIIQHQPSAGPGSSAAK